MKKLSFIFACLGLTVLVVSDARAQSGGTFTITQSVIAGGGGQAAGGTFAMNGTTGQPLVGTLSTGAGGAFTAGGGFWASFHAMVSGRVKTSEGRGVRNAIVNLIDPQSGTRQLQTGPLGAYSFLNVVPGQSYTITVVSRRFQFTPQIISVNDNLNGVDFIASP